ncbi:MAG: hypothetical protein OXE46_14885 [Chloroflexi bacterium]|nr:hypothetical protein [Chloroflexota bacterium]
MRQGELLSNVVQLFVELHTIAQESPRAIRRNHAFAYVLSQDCDLDWDFNSRTKPDARDRTIPSILLCEAMPAISAARQIIAVDGSKNTDKSRIWRRVKQNKDERYQFFSKVESSLDLQEQGIDELVIDFKRYFSVPTGELYKRIELGETHRRCRLRSPYLEHLSSRFAFYLSRVALPEDYHSEPGLVRRYNT